ncbi:DsbA family protein [Yersinia vastinensis]|uniref:DsbA family protein n=1 Tax=Yersinia vastinensis TaxID=2890318 RepID=UPI0005DB9B56|nr:DsbA family protein [Yersinia vastinensis]OVZ97199.1 DsbA family protein [Yersinia frederiksenii]CNI19434.1 thioredoxin-like protein clustered with PA0057 [Yersinia frederiksenii]CNI57703.1 thioredoxin-like protein clustered with PA0057 [Yersinia frederiksenii]CNK87332.1 thioredoxin-like protein clustered with PA0057 [Yersinia frederiksenii]
MSGTKLHYIFDPLCGWCYGAAPLLQVAQNIPDLTLVLHGGGMMSGPNRRQIDSQWRGYVMPHDRRIAQLTGQIFGDSYFNGLLNDTSAIMDSTPPIAAILAAEALAGLGVTMLHRTQQAHYVEGRRISDTPVLVELAEDIGLNREAFITAFNAAIIESDSHIADSRMLLAKVRGHGFPTFVLQDNQGKMTTLSASEYYGDPSGWLDFLTNGIAR